MKKLIYIDAFMRPGSRTKRIAAADRVVVAAQNLDYSSPEDIENKVHEAITEGLRLCEKF